MNLENNIVSNRFGILQEADTFISPLYSQLQIGYAIGRRRNLAHMSLGIDFSASSAKLKALVEGLERYASVIPQKAKVFKGLRSQLKSASVDPNEFILFDNAQNEQLLRPKYESSQIISWLEFRRFNDEPIYLPESAAYLTDPLESTYIPTSSNGCAAGFSEEIIRLNALAELIERDAIMVHWRTNQKPIEIDFNDLQLTDEIHNLMNNLPRQVLNVKFYYLPTEFNSCTILVAGFGLNSKWPAFISSAASHPVKEISLKKALLEFYLVLSLFHKSHLNKKDFSSPCPISPHDLKNFSDHSFYYYFFENFGPIKKFLANAEKIHFTKINSSSSENKNTLFSLIEQIEKLGYKVCFFDHTTSDIRLLNVRIARCVIPGLAMIHARHVDLMRNPVRYTRFLNFRGQPTDFEFNFNPHFFP